LLQNEAGEIEQTIERVGGVQWIKCKENIIDEEGSRHYELKKHFGW
jgi:hypothetical protein